MVTHPGAPDGADALRSLNAPKPVEVRASKGGVPLALKLAGRWVQIAAVTDAWRIGDGPFCRKALRPR